MRISSLAVFATIGVAVSAQPFSCFPRMRSTPSIKPYEQRMPAAPPGQQPFARGDLYPPAKGQVVSTVVPTPRTAAEAVELGRLYYQYYCQHCHGPRARGEGSVGRSYVPSPPGLTGARARALSDAQLRTAMVRGKGHDPVLASIVPADRRPLIARFLRSLAPGGPLSPASGSRPVSAEAEPHLQKRAR